MLEHLKKFFSTQVEQPAAQVAPQEEVELMTKPEAQADMAAETNATELASQLAIATEALVATQSQLTQLTEKFEAAQAALEEIEAAKAALIAEAAQAKMNARKAQIEATLGTDKAEAVLKATENLEDAAFDVVLSAFVKSLEVESQGTLFTEQGVAAEVDASKVAVESLEMQIIKAKQTKTS